MRYQSLERVLRIGFLALMLGSAACGGGGGAVEAPQPPPFDYEYAQPAATGDGWAVAHAADAGIDVARLEAMMNSIRGGAFDYVDSIVVAQDGKLVFDETIRKVTDAEDGRVGNTNLKMHAQFSTTKSITGVAVGIAIEQGYLPGVDALYLGLFPYSSYDNWDERKQDMTLGHVLAMQSGLAWNEWNPPYSSPDNQLIRFYETEVDFTKSLLDLPLAADPGTAFAYNTVATVSLAQAIENNAPLSFVDFGQNELLLPLGISDVEFLTTPTGLPNTGGGFYFLTRDMVKFGQLALDGGRWNDEQIVSAAWIDELVTLRTAITWENPEEWHWQLDGYGYHWWLGHYEIDSTVYDTWAMWGFGGQWVVVVPELNLVVAINSHGYDNDDGALNQVHELIARYVIPAVGSSIL